MGCYKDFRGCAHEQMLQRSKGLPTYILIHDYLKSYLPTILRDLKVFVSEKSYS